MEVSPGGLEVLHNVTTTCEGFEPNPDIAGVGVRLAFYISTWLSVILSSRSLDQAKGPLWVLVTTTAGLLIAALVEHSKGSLSLFDAIVVLHLSWLSNFASFFCSALVVSISARAPRSSLLVRIFTIPQTIFTLIWTVWLCAQPERFGSQPDCNAEAVVVVGLTYRVMGWGRVVVLFATALVTPVYIWVTGKEILGLFKNSQLPETKDEDGYESDCCDESLVKESKMRGPPSTFDPMLAAILLCFTPIHFFFVYNAEATVRRNFLHEGNSVWGFGQILPLVLVVPSIIEFTDSILTHGVATITPTVCQCQRDDPANRYFTNRAPQRQNSTGTKVE